MAQSALAFDHIQGLYDRLQTINDHIRSIKIISFMMVAFCEVKPLHLDNDDIADLGNLFGHLAEEIKDTADNFETFIGTLNKGKEI